MATRWRVAWVLILLGPLVVLGTVVPVRRASALVVVPSQFVAKMYSEALGRMPDPGGWRAYHDYFSGAGCSASTLRDVARQFYNSQEFLGLGYDNSARVLTLYRGASTASRIRADSTVGWPTSTAAR